jgi:hypothetical protein
MLQFQKLLEELERRVAIHDFRERIGRCGVVLSAELIDWV